MTKASIHIKACNIAQSEAHNMRTKQLDYIRNDLSHLNESYYFDSTPLAKLKKQIAKEVKAKTKRAMQKNAVPIHEAVAVIKDDTTMEELVMFCQHVQDRWGITPLQIHIHRDEGHMRSAAVRAWREHPDSNPWKPNLHAHIVWRSVHDNGKSVRLSSSDCEEMQTMYAEVMGMERGKRTGRKGLSAMEFKLQVKEKELEELLAINDAQGKTIAEQAQEIATLTQEMGALKSDKERIENARQKAQKDAQMAEQVKTAAEKKTAEAERRVGDAIIKLANLQKDISIGEIRKTAQAKATQIMQKDAKDLHDAKYQTMDAIAKLKTGGFFTSEETKKLRESLKRSALDSLKDWESKTQLAEQIKKLEEKVNTQRFEPAEGEVYKRTNEDLRKLYSSVANNLDEMNKLGLSSEQRSALIHGETIEVTKQWPDKEQITDELTATLRIEDDHLRMNDMSPQEFLRDFWAKVIHATNRAIEVFKQKFGLSTNSINMIYTRNSWGCFVSGDVNGTPLASKKTTEDTGRTIEEKLNEVSLMNEMEFRLNVLGIAYTREELQNAEKGIRAEQDYIQRQSLGRGI